MQRLQKWFKKYKKVVFMLTIAALLAIPLALTACGGTSADEEVDRPKTPFELESMIESDEADIQDIRSNIEGIDTKITMLQTTAQHDWSVEITAIQSQLATITARLNELINLTPQPTTPNGQPLPTQPPQTGSLTLAYTGDTDIEFEDNKEEIIPKVKISNGGSSATAKIKVTLTKLSGNADLPLSSIEKSVEFLADGKPEVDLIYSPYTTGLDCNKLILISQDITFANGIIVIPVVVTLDYNDDPPNDDPPQKWWSVSFTLIQ